MKLVSVVVPNYDCEDYLDRCLESVTSQTYRNLEIIICDNGSHDSSVAIINRWAKKDSRIKVLINEVNQGLINCYNRMFFAATGEYICITDADDWIDLQRVEKQVAVLDKYEVGLCLTNSVYYKHFFPPETESFGGSRFIDAETTEVWAPATMMFRRTILESIPGYHSYFHRLTSYDRYFILEMLDKFKGYYLDEPLYHVWARPASDHRTVDLLEPNSLRKAISQDTYDELKRQRLATGTDWLKENDMAAVKNYEEQQLGNKDYIAEKLRVYACIQIDYGNFEEGKKLLSAALRMSPFLVNNYKSLLYYFKAKFQKKKGYKELTNLQGLAFMFKLGGCHHILEHYNFFI